MLRDADAGRMRDTGRFLPLRVGGVAIGWIGPEWAERLAQPTVPACPFVACGGGFELCTAGSSAADRTRIVARWVRSQHARGLVPGWRGETMRVALAGLPLLAIERAMLRPLGLELRSATAVGWTQGARGPRIWVARRSPDKPVDPDRFDVLVGGGIRGAASIASTLVRECAEEASIPAVIARRARPCGTIAIARLARDAGCLVLHRERVAIHELELPQGFTPVPSDGESSRIVAMSPREALRSIAAGGWTRDGAIAVTDLIARRGW